MSGQHRNQQAQARSAEATRLLHLAIDDVARAIAGFTRAGDHDTAAVFQAHLENISRGSVTDAELALLQNDDTGRDMPPQSSQQDDLAFAERSLKYAILRLGIVEEKADRGAKSRIARQTMVLRTAVAKYKRQKREMATMDVRSECETDEEDERRRLRAWCFQHIEDLRLDM
ncbi:hypothetical protein LTR85_004401 [Meristemomyces frigidus]|nr:hypothetical protein LTR85_004401 [Meristemomyces frigidus]